MGTCVHFSRSLPSNSWWQTMAGWQVLSRPSAAEGGGRRPAFTGLATQPYSATEVDGWQHKLSRVSQNRAAVHVEISVNPKIAANILESFAKAGQLTIEFREGDEQPWVDRMIDSRKAMKAFNSCLEKISPTQPAPPVSSKPKPDNHI